MNTPIHPRAGDRNLNAAPVAASAYPRVLDIPDAFMMYANPTTKQIVNNAILTSLNVWIKVAPASFQLILIINLEIIAATKIAVPIDPTRSSLNTAAISFPDTELIILLWINGTFGFKASVLKNALEDFIVQMKMISVNTTNGDHATSTSFKLCFGVTSASLSTSFSSANLQVVFGFQNWSKITIDTNETNDERMSGNCSPMKLELTNCAIANDPPDTNNAGHTSNVFLNPAMINTK